MTDSKNKTLSEVLWSNSKINQVVFNKKKFIPTNNGHGLFVKTIGDDTLIDLRLSKNKPFIGHTHPLIVHHHFDQLKDATLANFYSISKTEFFRLTESFQKIDLSQILDDNLKTTTNDLLLTIDESILEHDFNTATKIILEFVESRLNNNIWIVEKDLSLLTIDSLYLFKDLVHHDRVNFCVDYHFVNSILVNTHHTSFVSDENLKFFVVLIDLVENILSSKGSNKTNSDISTIRNFLDHEVSQQLVECVGRYIISNNSILPDKLQEFGILADSLPGNKKTIFALPISCTNQELLDTLQRIKHLV